MAITTYLGDQLLNPFLNSDIVSPFIKIPTTGIPTNGLVAWYDASNAASYPGSGTSWYDISPEAGTGSIEGTPSFDSGTKLFTFDTTFDATGRVQIPQFIPEGQPTYSYYVIGSAADSGIGMLFGQGAEEGSRRAFMIRISGYFGFNGYFNDNNEPTGMDVATDVLKSIALTMDNDAANQNEALNFYLNGTLITTSGTTGEASNLNVGPTAYIGANAGGGELYNGKIGVCMAYDRVLSSEEITQINNYYSTIYTFA